MDACSKVDRSAKCFCDLPTGPMADAGLLLHRDGLPVQSVMSSIGGNNLFLYPLHCATKQFGEKNVY